MGTKEKPKPKPIEVTDIPYADFKQFISQRRFSLQFIYPITPQEHQDIVLHCVKSKDNPHGLPPIHATVRHCIQLDLFLVSKNFYDVTIDFKK